MRLEGSKGLRLREPLGVEGEERGGFLGLGLGFEEAKKR